MDKQFAQELNGILNKFGSYLLDRKIQGDQTPNDETFYQFINQKYKRFNRSLERLSQREGKPKSAIIFEYLSEQYKNGNYGLLFKANEKNEEPLKEEEIRYLEDRVQIQLADVLRGYREELQPYLSNEQNSVLVERLSKLLYERLDAEAKKRIDPKRIMKYILNLGFITISRVSHKDAVNFVMKYSSLFADQEEVLNKIVERYIDEELANTPIEKTGQRTNELEDEVRNLYASVKNEPR